MASCCWRFSMSLSCPLSTRITSIPYRLVGTRFLSNTHVGILDSFVSTCAFIVARAISGFSSLPFSGDFSGLSRFWPIGSQLLPALLEAMSHILGASSFRSNAISGNEVLAIFFFFFPFGFFIGSNSGLIDFSCLSPYLRTRFCSADTLAMSHFE